MKYIRTKDNFFGYIGKRSISLGSETKGNYYHSVIDRRLHRLGAGLLQDKYIVKQADSIEELCDEFVCIRKDNSKTLLSCIDEVLPLRMCYIGIYGAIWTDKGLIYVAKMNDKGELELL